MRVRGQQAGGAQGVDVGRQARGLFLRELSLQRRKPVLLLQLRVCQHVLSQGDEGDDEGLCVAALRTQVGREGLALVHLSSMKMECACE